MNRSAFEDGDVVQGFAPVDLSAADNDGDWVSLRDIERLIVNFVSGVGTAGEDPVISLQQATSAAGAGAKNLTFTKLRHKVGATALSGVTAWTEVTQAAAASYDTDGIDGAENECQVAIEIRPEMLDVDGGFSYVRGRVADVGDDPQLGYLEYIAFARKNAKQNPTSINA